jgi:hypothetical protein
MTAYTLLSYTIEPPTLAHFLQIMYPLVLEELTGVWTLRRGGILLSI